MRHSGGNIQTSLKFFAKGGISFKPSGRPPSLVAYLLSTTILIPKVLSKNDADTQK